MQLPTALFFLNLNLCQFKTFLYHLPTGKSLSAQPLQSSAPQTTGMECLALWRAVEQHTVLGSQGV